MSLPRVSSAATGLWFAAMLVPLSDAGIGFPTFVAALAGAGLVAAIRIVAAARAPAPRRRVRRAFVWILMLATLVASGAVFVDRQSALNPLLRVRFALSRGALDALAQAPRALPAPARIGWYRVDHVEAFDDEVRVITTGCGVVDRCGFLYRKGAPPRARPKTRLEPLAGPWFLLYEVF